MTERVVVVGHGAREHALAHKLSVGREVVVVGGNAGIAREFECVAPIMNVDGIVAACRKIQPDLVVIGPENLLALGVADALGEANINVFGPKKNAARLESSKSFSKFICERSGVTTAAFSSFDNFVDAREYIENSDCEALVIKVDGLCAGKGVSVCKTRAEALAVVEQLFNHDGFSRLGVKDKHLLIEECLVGGEVSVFGAAFGLDVALFSPMQDHKRLLDHDGGPNTGGMGAVGPLGSVRDREKFLAEVKERIFLPVLRTMATEKMAFSGLLYAGLMLTTRGVYLLEFNVRFGDPETQALLFGTHVDVFPLLHGIAVGAKLNMDYWQSALLDMDPTISIVIASGGYPLGMSESVPLRCSRELGDAKIFYASTTSVDGIIHANHGRVLSVVARGASVDVARTVGYELVRGIEFAGMQYRKDIGCAMTKLIF